MSTDLKPVGPMVLENDTEMSLTQYCGRPRNDGGDRRRLQLTQMLPEGRWGYVQLSKEQAMMLAYALIEWTQDQREEDE